MSLVHCGKHKLLDGHPRLCRQKFDCAVFLVRHFQVHGFFINLFVPNQAPSFLGEITKKIFRCQEKFAGWLALASCPWRRKRLFYEPWRRETVGKGKNKRQRKGKKSRFTYRKQQAAPARRALPPEVRVTLAWIKFFDSCVKYGGIVLSLAFLLAIVLCIIYAPEGKGTLVIEVFESLTEFIKSFGINSKLGVILFIFVFLILPFLLFIGYKIRGQKPLDTDDTDIEV